MNIGEPMAFNMPEGWTLRRVATALARDWLVPFRAEPGVKSTRWVVQPIVEEPNDAKGPLWESGISTEEYEERLDRPGLRWAIRARTGRGAGTILARLALKEGDPGTFVLECSQESFPQTLFDGGKLTEFLESQGKEGATGLMSGLLLENGFQMVSQTR